MTRAVLILCSILLFASPARALLLEIADSCAASAQFFSQLAAAPLAFGRGADPARATDLSAALAATAAGCPAIATTDGVARVFPAFYSFYVVLDPDGPKQRRALWPRLCAVGNAGLPAGHVPRNIVFVPLDAVSRIGGLAELPLHEANQFTACDGSVPYWR